MSCEVMHPWRIAGPTPVRTEYSTVGNGEIAMMYRCMCESRQYSQYSSVGTKERSTNSMYGMRREKRGLDRVAHHSRV